MPRFYLCPTRVESVWNCGSSIIKSRWPSKSDSLGIPSSFVRSPGCEAWGGAQNFPYSGRTSLALLFSSLYVAHPASMGFDFSFCAPPTILWLLGLWTNVLLLMTVQQLVVILVLLHKMNTCLSTPSSWTVTSMHIIFLWLLSRMYSLKFSDFSPIYSVVAQYLNSRESLYHVYCILKVSTLYLPPMFAIWVKFLPHTTLVCSNSRIQIPLFSEKWAIIWNVATFITFVLYGLLGEPRV